MLIRLIKLNGIVLVALMNLSSLVQAATSIQLAEDNDLTRAAVDECWQKADSIIVGKTFNGTWVKSKLLIKCLERATGSTNAISMREQLLQRWKSIDHSDVASRQDEEAIRTVLGSINAKYSPAVRTQSADASQLSR